jgi:hypothetical protein
MGPRRKGKFPPVLFDLYWRAFGLPLSRLKGLVADAIPFSVVECALWTGTAATLWLLLSLGVRRGALRSKRLRLASLLLGPMFLIALGLGQGAFPWSLAPTALREPLSGRLQGNALPEAAFREWAASYERDLQESLAGPAAWNSFQALTERQVLAGCDTALDRTLADLGLPAGRTVRTYKDMGPWTTALGLLYGGPAFHDPFFSEIGIITREAYPTPHYWRLIAACHEAAHAKGFTREMDAEILTHLALLNVDDTRFSTLAGIHFLRKTGLKIAWPDSLVADARRAALGREAAEARRPVLMRIKGWLTGTALQNSGTKYGERTREEEWDPRHPFFSTISAIHLRHEGRGGREP